MTKVIDCGQLNHNQINPSSSIINLIFLIFLDETYFTEEMQEAMESLTNRQKKGTGNKREIIKNFFRTL